MTPHCSPSRAALAGADAAPSAPAGAVPASDAAGAAVAAGVFVLKNPTLTAAVAKAFMETRRPPR